MTLIPKSQPFVYQWQEDIKILCQEANRFPEGIQAAFDTLEHKYNHIDQRTWYGISCMAPDGSILYKAGLSKLPSDEPIHLEQEEFTITKGNYLAVTIPEWEERIEEIGSTFQELLQDPRLDTTFPCLEWYHDKDITCLIRLKNV